jgi:hypothetical protein
MDKEDSYCLRLAEISSGLKRRVCIAQTLNDPAKWDHPLLRKTTWQRLFGWLDSERSAIDLERTRPERLADLYVIGWAEASMQCDDELWFYEIGSGLCGETGYAILRDGTIIDFFPVMEY